MENAILQVKATSYIEATEPPRRHIFISAASLYVCRFFDYNINARALATITDKLFISNKI